MGFDSAVGGNGSTYSSDHCSEEVRASGSEWTTCSCRAR